MKFLTFLTLINIGISQSSIITGTIKDSKTKKPLVGANVFLLGTSLGTVTNDNGDSFSLSNHLISSHKQKTPQMRGLIVLKIN